MGRKCSVQSCLSCSNRPEDEQVTFHKLPANEAIRLLWLKQCHMPVEAANKVIYVCSRHFRRADFHAFTGVKYMLKAGSIPSIFQWGRTSNEELEVLTKDIGKSNSKSERQNDATATQSKSKMPKESSAKISKKRLSVQAGASKRLNSEPTVRKRAESLFEHKAAVPGTFIPSDDVQEPELKFDLTTMNFVNGTRLEAQNFQNLWIVAKVLEVDHEESEILIQFEETRTEEWIPMNSSRLRPLKRKQVAEGLKFAVGERCNARWNNNRRFPATVRKVLENDMYEVYYDDGYQKTVPVSHLSKWKSQGTPKSKSKSKSSEQAKRKSIIISTTNKPLVTNQTSDIQSAIKSPLRVNDETVQINLGGGKCKDLKNDSHPGLTADISQEIKPNDVPMGPPTAVLPGVHATPGLGHPEQMTSGTPWACKWVNGIPQGRPGSIESIDGLRDTVIVEDSRLPSGWVKHISQRTVGYSAGKWDVVLVNSGNRKFRGRKELEGYLNDSGEKYDPEVYDFGLHRKDSKDLGWDITTSPAAAGVKRKYLTSDKPTGVTLPKAMKTEFKMPTPISKPASTEISVEEPIAVDDLEIGYVRVGSLKVQIIDNLFRCPKENCSKNFRKENLFQMHIKHYHPDLAKFLGSTPNVADLAYARTIQTTPLVEREVPKNRYSSAQFYEKISQIDTHLKRKSLPATVMQSRVDGKNEEFTTKAEESNEAIFGGDKTSDGNSVKQVLEVKIENDAESNDVKVEKTCDKVTEPLVVTPPLIKLSNVEVSSDKNTTAVGQSQPNENREVNSDQLQSFVSTEPECESYRLYQHLEPSVDVFPRPSTSREIEKSQTALPLPQQSTSKEPNHTLNCPLLEEALRSPSKFEPETMYELDKQVPCLPKDMKTTGIKRLFPVRRTASVAESNLEHEKQTIVGQEEVLKLQDPHDVDLSFDAEREIKPYTVTTKSVTFKENVTKDIRKLYLRNREKAYMQKRLQKRKMRKNASKSMKLKMIGKKQYLSDDGTSGVGYSGIDQCLSKPQTVVLADTVPEEVLKKVTEAEKPNSPQYITEDGQKIRLVQMRREEIINCLCGFTEEDGLMMQCDLCLCWQHANCHGIEKESQVPEKYVCYICLNPRKARESQRFVNDQDWLLEGKLPELNYMRNKPKLEILKEPAEGEEQYSAEQKAHIERYLNKIKEIYRPIYETTDHTQKVQRYHELAGNMYELLVAIKHLQRKIIIAQTPNHPKLYYWAKPWEQIELDPTQWTSTTVEDLKKINPTIKIEHEQPKPVIEWSEADLISKTAVKVSDQVTYIIEETKYGNPYMKKLITELTSEGPQVTTEGVSNEEVFQLLENAMTCTDNMPEVTNIDLHGNDPGEIGSTAITSVITVVDLDDELEEGVCQDISIPIVDPVDADTNLYSVPSQKKHVKKVHFAENTKPDKIDDPQLEKFKEFIKEPPIDIKTIEIRTDMDYDEVIRRLVVRSNLFKCSENAMEKLLQYFKTLGSSDKVLNRMTCCFKAAFRKENKKREVSEPVMAKILTSVLPHAIGTNTEHFMLKYIEIKHEPIIEGMTSQSVQTDEAGIAARKREEQKYLAKMLELDKKRLGYINELRDMYKEELLIALSKKKLNVDWRKFVNWERRRIRLKRLALARQMQLKEVPNKNKLSEKTKSFQTMETNRKKVAVVLKILQQQNVGQSKPVESKGEIYSAYEASEGKSIVKDDVSSEDNDLISSEAELPTVDTVDTNRRKKKCKKKPKLNTKFTGKNKNEKAEVNITDQIKCVESRSQPAESHMLCPDKLYKNLTENTASAGSEKSPNISAKDAVILKRLSAKSPSQAPSIKAPKTKRLSSSKSITVSLQAAKSCKISPLAAEGKIVESMKTVPIDEELIIQLRRKKFRKQSSLARKVINMNFALKYRRDKRFAKSLIGAESKEIIDKKIAQMRKSKHYVKIDTASAKVIENTEMKMEVLCYDKNASETDSPVTKNVHEMKEHEGSWPLEKMVTDNFKTEESDYEEADNHESDEVGKFADEFMSLQHDLFCFSKSPDVVINKETLIARLEMLQDLIKRNKKPQDEIVQNQIEFLHQIGSSDLDQEELFRYSTIYDIKEILTHTKEKFDCEIKLLSERLEKEKQHQVILDELGQILIELGELARKIGSTECEEIAGSVNAVILKYEVVQMICKVDGVITPDKDRKEVDRLVENCTVRLLMLRRSPLYQTSSKKTKEELYVRELLKKTQAKLDSLSEHVLDSKTEEDSHKEETVKDLNGCERKIDVTFRKGIKNFMNMCKNKDYYDIEDNKDVNTIVLLKKIELLLEIFARNGLTDDDDIYSYFYEREVLLRQNKINKNDLKVLLAETNAKLNTEVEMLGELDFYQEAQMIVEQKQQYLNKILLEQSDPGATADYIKSELVNSICKKDPNKHLDRLLTELHIPEIDHKEIIDAPTLFKRIIDLKDSTLNDLKHTLKLAYGEFNLEQELINRVYRLVHHLHLLKSMTDTRTEEQKKEQMFVDRIKLLLDIKEQADRDTAQSDQVEKVRNEKATKSVQIKEMNTPENKKNQHAGRISKSTQCYLVCYEPEEECVVFKPLYVVALTNLAKKALERDKKKLNMPDLTIREYLKMLKEDDEVKDKSKYDKKVDDRMSMESLFEMMKSNNIPDERVTVLLEKIDRTFTAVKAKIGIRNTISSDDAKQCENTKHDQDNQKVDKLNTCKPSQIVGRLAITTKPVEREIPISTHENIEDIQKSDVFSNLDYNVDISDIFETDNAIPTDSELVSILQGDIKDQFLSSDKKQTSDDKTEPLLNPNINLFEYLDDSKVNSTGKEEVTVAEVAASLAGLLTSPGGTQIDLQLSDAELLRLAETAAQAAAEIGIPHQSSNLPDIAAPWAPEPEEAIDTEMCRYNLVRHIHNYQEQLEKVLSAVYVEIQLLIHDLPEEARRNLTLPKMKEMIIELRHGLDTLEKISHCSKESDGVMQKKRKKWTWKKNQHKLLSESDATK